MHVLLTGTGFSRNWGGWLANEAFEYLLGCPEVDDHLRHFLWKHKRQGGGFEDALAELQLENSRGARASTHRDSRPNTGSAKNQPASATTRAKDAAVQVGSLCFFYGLLLLENSSVKSALPPVMEPLHSDAACPILLGPLSGPAAGAVHW